MKKTAFLLLLLAIGTSAIAYRIEWGKSITISRPVFEDLYIAGGNVTINAPIYGDLIVAGGTVTINDTVKNDLLLAGGNVFIRGYIGDDIRCAGGKLLISTNVGNDLVITGGNVEITWNSLIGGGLIISGGDVIVDGTIKGNIKSAAGKLAFNGIAYKNFESRSDDLTINGVIKGKSILAARKIHIGNKASFHDGIRYWTRDRRRVAGNALTNGNAVYDPSLKIRSSNWYLLGHDTVFSFIWYVATVFAFILLIELLFSGLFKKAGHTVNKSVARSIGMGLLFFIGVPIASVVLLLTIIGIPFALLLVAGYVVIILLATIITSLVIANWYSEQFGHAWNYWKLAGAAMALFVLFKLLTFTPFFGWLFMLAIACIAFGNIIRNIHWKRTEPGLA